MKGPSNLLHPELVHSRECVGEFRFNVMPTIKIGHRPAIVREQRAVFFQSVTIKSETEKSQFVFSEEGLDHRDRRAVLLHVKQQIAALAHAEIVVKSREAA